MTKVCAWCGDVVADADSEGLNSHTICDACVEKYFPEEATA